MAHIRTVGAGPDGFETGQSVEYQRNGHWRAAVIDWKFENTRTGNSGWVIRMLDAPSHSDLQTVPFGSELMRAV